MSIRLGKIGYLNTIPIYHPIESGAISGPLSVVSDTPAALNTLMRENQLDISACSSIEYGRNPEKYLLVPDLAIGSRGHVQSVLLLSREPVAKLDGKTLRVTAQSHTSVALMKLFLHTRLGVRPEYEDGSVTEAIEKGEYPDAFLAIGDEALRLRNHPEYPHRWDLGSAWLDWTGLPFIFGVWIVRRDVVEEHREELAEACRALVAAKEWSAARPEHIAELASRFGFLDKEAMLSYFDGLVYDFGRREQEGLKLFFSKLAESGEIPRVPDLEFFEI